MRFSRNTVFRASAGLFLLFLVAVAVAIFFVLYTPRLLERHLTAFLTDNGYEVITLEVDRAGLSGARLAAGELLYNGHSLRWESFTLGYSPTGLIQGQFEGFAIREPALYLQFTEAILPAHSDGRLLEFRDTIVRGSIGSELLIFEGSGRLDGLSFHDLEGTYSFLDGSLRIHLGLRDPEGSEMGSVSFGTIPVMEETLSGGVRLQPPDGDPFLEGSFLHGVDQTEIRLSGELPFTWIRAIGEWWSGRAVPVSGESPYLTVELSRKGLFWQGKLRLLLDSTRAEFANGVTVAGLGADLRFAVNGLPHSEGKQLVYIESLSTSAIHLRNLQLEFALPTVRTLLFSKAGAEFGGGGLSLDPFMMDPFRPAFRTTLRLYGIPAEPFRAWLAEQGLHPEATLSGSIPMEWRNGMLVPGEAVLRMDNSTTKKRFPFSGEDLFRLAGLTGP